MNISTKILNIAFFDLNAFQHITIKLMLSSGDRKISTDIRCFDLRVIKDNIVPNDIVRFCDMLTRETGRHYGINFNEHPFNDEMYFEIFFTRYDMNGSGFKSMKFTLKRNLFGVKRRLGDPEPKNVTEIWKDDSHSLLSYDDVLFTQIVSQGNAPEWNQFELDKFKYCLDLLGLAVMAIPSSHYLNKTIVNQSQKMLFNEIRKKVKTS